MKSEENKLLVRRFYEEVVNTGNIDLIESLVSPEYCEVHDGTKHAVGIEGAKAHIAGVRQTYPDLHITIGQQIAKGEWVVSCITAASPSVDTAVKWGSIVHQTRGLAASWPRRARDTSLSRLEEILL